ncbi:MFS transporter [Actinoplanes sp. NPDC051411]|uniref:MFS transporter n=1 Tax=Actinoplanes sp. NPDC051411 TaxID=3155522 RepID=UPI003446256E
MTTKSLAGAALAFNSLYLAAGALTPLLVVYRRQWDFAPVLLTVAFAAYAIGFLAAALTLGSLSDHLGRRPVLIGSLAVQLVSNLMFLFASDVGWVIAGRVVQGVVSGAATAAFTAVLVELSPARRKGLGPILGSVGLTGGLALGSLLAGLGIQLTAHANTIAFVTLSVLTVAGALAILAAPETISPRPGALRALIPDVAIPPAARAEFFAAAPVVAAVWMLAGLSGGLAPSMVQTVFHRDSGLLDGLAGFIAPAVSVIVGLSFARVRPRTAMSIGIYASIAGSLGIIGGAASGHLVAMFAGQAVAGLGFGAAFTAALGLVIPLADAHQRAGVVAGIYVVSYLGLGVPVVVAGALTDSLGVVPTVGWYSAVVVVLALISLGAQRRLGKRNIRKEGTQMNRRVFLAGASGVLGQRLIPLLVKEGYVVGGMTRSAGKTELLRHLGAEPILCDVFDRDALIRAVADFAPDVILNELTDLPDDVTNIGAHAERNARIRTEGNRNLIAAARRSGSAKLLAQSVAWQLPDGPDARAVTELERSVLAEGGVVLSYGQFYGPGTYNEDQIPADPRVQIDRAAERTVEALDAPSGVVVITD